MAFKLDEFLIRPRTTQPMVIGRGVLPKSGKLIIGGTPKANKSFIALNMALNMAAGEHIFGAYYKSGTPVLPVAKPHRVLYIEMEIGEEGLKDRLKPLLGSRKHLEDLDLFIKTRDTGMRMDTPEGRERIEYELAMVKPDVVILDPLSKFHVSNENSAQEMGAIMRVGDHWIERYGTAIVYIHHTGLASFDPDNRRSGGSKLRGSSAIFADTDTFMEVVRKSSASTKEPIIKLDFELRRGEPLEPIFVKRRLDGSVEYVETDYGGASEYRPRPQHRGPYADL